MQVGGIVGAGAGGSAAGAMAGPSGSMAIGTSSPAGTATRTGIGPTALQSLVDVLAGYSTAEILMALFLAAALSKHDDSDRRSDSLALLAGLALASQLQQSFGLSINLSGQSAGLQLTVPAGVGTTINVVA